MNIYRVILSEYEYAWPVMVGYYTTELHALREAHARQDQLNRSTAILGNWSLRPATALVNSWSTEKIIWHWVWEPIDQTTYPPFNFTKAMYLEEIEVQEAVKQMGMTIANADKLEFASGSLTTTVN